VRLNIKIEDKKVIPFYDNFTRFRNYLIKHTGLSKEDIVKESKDVYLICDRIFEYGQCVICITDNESIEKDERFLIVEYNLIKLLQDTFGEN
jgi:hypothetical protein